MKTNRFKMRTALLLAAGLLLPFSAYAVAEKPAPVAKEAKQAEKKKSKSTADHTKFKELQKNFKTGPEVTKACLECHTEAAKQVHNTKHWTWEFLNPVTKQRLGKKNVINNFCTSVQSNQTFCSACHVLWLEGRQV